MFLVSSNISDSSEKEISKQTGVNPIYKIVGELKCILFHKKNLPVSEVFFQEGDNWIFATGTWVYGLKYGKDSLESLLRDLCNNSVKEESLRGQFVFVVCRDANLQLYSDASGIVNIYYDENGSISSSFLALMRAQDKPHELNKWAAMEVLSTGNLISPDTLVKGICRWHPRSGLTKINGLRINIASSPLLQVGQTYKNRTDALNHQEYLLDDLMRKFAELQASNRTDLGITGGLDSRVLLGFAIKNWKKENINLYTNSRIRKTGEMVIDEPIAAKVASALDMPLKYGWMRHPSGLNDEDLNEVMEQAYHFSDGHVRMHIQYFEEYNTANFKQKVLNGSGFNLSGIGGEQYRNQERITGVFSSRDFIKYKTILFAGGEVLGRYTDKVIDYLDKKIKDRLGVHSSMWTLLEAKKYYNEVVNSERLGARNNLENKLGWFLSPFAEAELSMNAYSLYPYLKFSPDFQIDLLKRVSSTLANVPLDYGFNPQNGIPFSYKVGSYSKGLIPWSLFYKIRIKPNFRNGYALFDQLKELPCIARVLNVLEASFPNLRLDEILVRPDMMPVAINLGYFIYKETNEGTLIIRDND